MSSSFDTFESNPNSTRAQEIQEDLIQTSQWSREKINRAMEVYTWLELTDCETTLNVDKIAERLGEEPEAVIRKVDRYRESDPTLKVNLVSSHKNVKLLKPDENGRLAKFDQAKADKAAAKMAKEKAKIAEKLAKKKAKAAEKKSNTDPNELITLRVVVVKKEPEDDNVAATTTEANERPRKKVRYIAEYNERDYLEGAAEEMGRWIAECAEKK